MKNPQPVTRTGREPSGPHGSGSRPAAPGPLVTHPDEPGGSELFRAVDRVAAAMAANATGGISPTALWLAYSDWLVHLSRSPGKQAELVIKAWLKTGRLAAYALRRALTDDETPNCIEPLPGDSRFRAEAWQEPPFSLWYQAFLVTQQWWHNATHDVPGVSPHHENVVSFSTRQVLDVFSPSNCIFTNPEVIDRALQTGGRSFVDGFQRFLDEFSRNLNGEPPPGTDKFRVGKDVAVTPGKVVYRNHLIELIQYAPSTGSVHPEPLLIVPAWIMKFYILDLSPENSLIRYLVGQGFTVFCISWRNVTAADRNLGLDDYRRLGVMAALGAIGAIVPDSKIHGIGYCLGGTLLSIAAAAMAHVADERLASITLLAAQTDFSEPGELELFIDHSQVESLEGLMWQRGYLPAFHMAGAFQLLRTNDLIWSRMLRHYLMDEAPAVNDLIAWNADATRLPYRMHSEYLRSLFLNGDLAAGRYVVDEHPVAIQNIRAPIFAVGTEWDHIAPWPSVYKIHYLSDTDVTFVLTSGGHNAGIVSEPRHPGRHYWFAHKMAEDPCLHADRWSERAEFREGSWWPAWVEWLEARSSHERVPPPAMGAPGHGLPVLADAPGTYVYQR